jgi:DNA processing protein
VLLPGDDDYPAALSELHDPPPHLFAIGELALLRAPAVAIVGTRRATPYGERVARELSAALARAGVAVVSGLARGIDAAAHRAALDAGGGTIAVLGTGVDVPYPAAHRALHREIGAAGLLLAEELPGVRPTNGSFPKRNRLIAALARATIVVEAPVRSGALITAAQALDLGRAVAAVPGPIDAPASGGTNELLRDGAIVIAAVADALALVGAPPPPAAPPVLDSPAERAVWEALAAGPADLDLLAARATIPARECLAAVTMLEMRGVVECTVTGEIRRRPGDSAR